jgi:hypothetical protein
MTTDLQQEAPRFVNHPAQDVRGTRIALLALVITALAYLATLSFGFVYDDLPQIVNNPTLYSWKSVATFFTAHTWKFLLPEWPGNYYRPLFMTWLLFNHKMFGNHIPMWHATTLLIHLIVTWLAFVLSRQLLRNAVQAGFVAMLFGLHAIHIEAVAWVSGATDTLMAAFVLAAFWAWVKSERDPDRGMTWKVVSAVFYAGGCLCKETALLFPVVVIAHDVLRGQYERTANGVLRAAIRAFPLWVVAGSYLCARFLALRGLAHPIRQPIGPILLTIPTILWGYMRRLVWPVNLSVFYGTPPVTSVWSHRFWISLSTLAIAAVLAWRIGKRSRLTGVALIWIFTFLAPAIIGLPEFPAGEWIHDRYLYLPSFGFCLLVAYALAQLPSQKELFGLPATESVIVLILAGGMAVGTAFQEQYWRNDFLLFAHATRICPDSSWAKSHLAAVVFTKGDFENSRRLYEEALQIDPGAWRIQIGYGLMLFYAGRFQEADSQLAKAIALAPFDSNEYFYQGMSRFNLGRFSDAEASFRKAIETGPRIPRYHFWLGFTMEKLGRVAEAKREYELELSEHPDTDTQASQRLKKLSQ